MVSEQKDEMEKGKGREEAREKVTVSDNAAGKGTKATRGMHYPNKLI